MEKIENNEENKKKNKIDSRFQMIEKNYKGHNIMFDNHYNFYLWGILQDKTLEELKIKIRDRPDIKAKEKFNNNYYKEKKPKS